VFYSFILSNCLICMCSCFYNVISDNNNNNNNSNNNKKKNNNNKNNNKNKNNSSFRQEKEMITLTNSLSRSLVAVTV